MSSPLEPEQRYPKRQRATITYYDPADYQDNLGKNSNTIGVLTDNSAANNDKATRSHSDEDWVSGPSERRAIVTTADRIDPEAKEQETEKEVQDQEAKALPVHVSSVHQDLVTHSSSSLD